MGITAAGYANLPRLLKLEETGRHCLLQTPSLATPAEIRTSPATPPGGLPGEYWEAFLRLHPDQGYAAFIQRGIRWGFRIGFSKLAARPTPATDNLKSTLATPEVVDEYIASEVASGKLRVAPPLSAVHRSPIRIIPKPHQPGKYRLIVDLSSPRGKSVNDGIAEDLCTVQYANVDDAIRLLNCLGKGSLMAKLDLKSAYRMVPVHKEDQSLLGIAWKETAYIDTALPFGLRSAPLIFTAVADGLAWAMTCCGVEYVIHYLDDFFFCAPPSAPTQCSTQLQTAIVLCELLGFPVAMHKVETPSLVLTFLGLELDSIKQEVRLPKEKLIRLKALLQSWQRRRSASKHQLQCLLGHLHHAASVVRPGRSFTHSLLQALKRFNQPSHKTQWVRLSAQARDDLAWWDMFLHEWNGIAYYDKPHKHVKVVSDASGSWGCAMIEEATGCWCQIPWPTSWKNINIAIKELLPVVIAAAIWGRRWKGTTVTFWIDNQAAVAALTSRRARDPHLSHLLRCLFFYEAHFDFLHKAEHIPGRLNCAADALSRNNLDLFLSLTPQAQPQASMVPTTLLEALADKTLTWSSSRWKTVFRDSLSRV